MFFVLFLKLFCDFDLISKFKKNIYKNSKKKRQKNLDEGGDCGQKFDPKTKTCTGRPTASMLGNVY